MNITVLGILPFSQLIKEGLPSLIYKTHTIALGLIETYGKNLREAVRKRDQIAFESFKYLVEKTKNLNF